jgi:superfamily II DNA or RNA helicase
VKIKKISYDVPTCTTSTWQSVYAIEDPKWFNFFDGIIIDETHLAAAQSLKSIMEKSTDVHYRIGLTGTLSGSKTHELVITGLLGKISKIATTQDLIEQGHVSSINIKCLVLEYQNKEEKKLIKGADYQGEINYICTLERRAILVGKIALESAGNTIVMFNFREHGEMLYKYISEHAAEGRKVFFIHGDIDGDERNSMRAIVEKENDAIIVASFGTTSTGVSIKRINTIIAASPTKSVIRLLQTIGRGLRKADDKDSFTWIDLVDSFNTSKSGMNYAYKHFIERLKIYNEQGFEYKIVKFPF